MDRIDDIRHLPELGGDEIHIWGVHVPAVENQLDRLHGLLCGEEQEKAARFFREPDRQASIAARGALRVLLSGHTGIPATELVFGHSENGKPFLIVPQAARLPADEQEGRRAARDTETSGIELPPGNISFNVSHSGEWIVLAFGRNRSIGVDIEKIRPEIDVMAIASRYFTAGECALIQEAEDPHAIFYRLWSRKEAYVKAIGSGLFQEISSFEVPLEDGEKGGWFFHELEAGSQHAAAVVSDQEVSALPCYDFSGLQW